VDTALDQNEPLVAGIFGASLALWFAVWSVVVIPTALIGLLFKKSKPRPLQPNFRSGSRAVVRSGAAKGQRRIRRRRPIMLVF
jgi:hypothetical protein